MKNGLLALALCLSIPALLRADPLWLRAIEVYSSNAGAVPGTMEMRFDQYNGRGEIVSRDEAVVAMELAEDGEVRATVVSARSNGKDVTEQRRARGQGGGPPFGGPPSESDDGSGFAGLLRSPFDPEEQEHLTLSRTSAPAPVNDISAQAFEFEHRTGERSVNRGTAWLDAQTGEPVALRLTLEPLPRFMSELVMTQYYGRNPEGRWIVQRLEFAGEGGVLFIRRRLESVMLFSNYFAAPPPPSTR